MPSFTPLAWGQIKPLIQLAPRPVNPLCWPMPCTPTFAAFRPALRRTAVVLRLPMKPEAVEMNGLVGRVAGTRDRAAFAALFSHFAPG